MEALMRKLNTLFWDTTLNIILMNVIGGSRALHALHYRFRSSSPMEEAAASSTAQSGFESQEDHVRADLTASG